MKIGVAVAVVLDPYEWLIAACRRPTCWQCLRAPGRALLLIFLGALPLLKLKGPYFAVATCRIGGGGQRVQRVARVGAGGGMQLKSDVTPTEMYYVAPALLVVTTAAIWRWMRSSYGPRFTGRCATTRTPRAPAGVDVNRVKAAVFLFSATVTGLAAGLYYMDVVIITPPSAFSLSWASAFVFIVVAGGMGTVAGPADRRRALHPR